MFWEKFLDLCSKNKVSPNQVAQKIGIASGTITKWKQGSKPRDLQLKKIANYFNVPLDYFSDDPASSSAYFAIRMARDPSFAEQVQKRGVRVPVYGNVAAGIPIEAITDIEDYEEISQEMAATGEFAALRIHGDSMEPKMSDGDIVIVRIQETIETGETAIVMINGGDATCKRIVRTPEGITLISTNPKYSPMFYSNKQIEELPVRIWGKVVELRAKF
jgi:repressor LexA